MILGIGTDIANIERFAENIEQHGKKFMQRCFTESERAEADEKSDEQASIAYLAKRWAGKEAFVKALGTGFDSGVYLKDIEILNNQAGKPFIKLYNGAEAMLKKITPHGYSAEINISLSDDFPTAIAFVVIDLIKNDRERTKQYNEE